jgi:hypothetical protein
MHIPKSIKVKGFGSISELAVSALTLTASFEVLPAVLSFPHFPLQSLHPQKVAPRAQVMLQLLVSVADDHTFLAAEASTALLESLRWHRAAAAVTTTETTRGPGSAEISWRRVVADRAS